MDTVQDCNIGSIIELKPVALKKSLYCPKPILLRTVEDNYYILLITDFFSDKKCLCYDIEREHYFELCQYPDLRFIDPVYSASPSGQSLYIYDGEHQSFAMLDIDIDRNDACHHPKVSNIRKTKRKTEKLRNLVKTGKGCLSIYLPHPWNEFHIIGGSINRAHLKWSTKHKQPIKHVIKLSSALCRAARTIARNACKTATIKDPKQTEPKLVVIVLFNAGGVGL